MSRLLGALEEAGYRVVEAYLFGSYARGDWVDTSDVDLVIVSPHFSEMRMLERLDLIARLQLRLNLGRWVEALPYTPEEFEEAKHRSVAIRDASRYWIKIR